MSTTTTTTTNRTDKMNTLDTAHPIAELDLNEVWNGRSQISPDCFTEEDGILYVQLPDHGNLGDFYRLGPVHRSGWNARWEHESLAAADCHNTGWILTPRTGQQYCDVFELFPDSYTDISECRICTIYQNEDGDRAVTFDSGEAVLIHPKNGTSHVFQTPSNDWLRENPDMEEIETLTA